MVAQGYPARFLIPVKNLGNTFELTCAMFLYNTKFINVGIELPSYKNTQTRSLSIRHADEKITPDKKQFPGLSIRHWLREQIIAGSVYDRL
jgi:hypothetical protein